MTGTFEQSRERIKAWADIIFLCLKYKWTPFAISVRVITDPHLSCTWIYCLSLHIFLWFAPDACTYAFVKYSNCHGTHCLPSLSPTLAPAGPFRTQYHTLEWITWLSICGISHTKCAVCRRNGRLSAVLASLKISLYFQMTRDQRRMMEALKATPRKTSNLERYEHAALSITGPTIASLWRNVHSLCCDLSLSLMSFVLGYVVNLYLLFKALLL